MGQCVFVAGYFCKGVGSGRRIYVALVVIGLLGFVNFVSVQVKNAEFQQRFAIAGPNGHSFLVGGLGGFPFFLVTKAVSKIEEKFYIYRRAGTSWWRVCVGG